MTPPIDAVDGQLVRTSDGEVYVYDKTAMNWIKIKPEDTHKLETEELLSPQSPISVIRKEPLEDKPAGTDYDREWAHPETSEQKQKISQESIDEEITSLLGLDDDDDMSESLKEMPINMWDSPSMKYVGDTGGRTVKTPSFKWMRGVKAE